MEVRWRCVSRVNGRFDQQGTVTRRACTRARPNMGGDGTG